MVQTTRTKRLIKAFLVASLIVMPLHTPPAQASNSWWGHRWGKWWHQGQSSQCVVQGSDAERWQWQAGASQLTLNGSAAETSDSIRLTDAEHQAGTAFWQTPYSLYTQYAKPRSFSSAFSFRISDPSGISDRDGQGGDGLTFVINASDQQVGYAGGGLGYRGLYNSISVEFDTFNNGRRDRNNGNHIAVNRSGRMHYSGLRAEAERFNDGDIWYAWVDYRGDKRLLEVRIAKTEVRPVDPVLKKRISIPWWLGGSQGYVGFSAGTGDAGNRHEILSFEFIDVHAPIGECDPPRFTSEPVETATSGELYQYQVQAEDPTPNDRLSYRLIEGPTGMSIDADTGLLNWSPGAFDIGEHPVELEVSDSIGLADRQGFTLTVEPGHSCGPGDGQSIVYEHFGDVSDWQLNGSAAGLTPNEHLVLRLTRQLSQNGSAYLKKSIPLTDGLNFRASFSAAFGFKLSAPIGISDEDGTGADGLVFVLQTMNREVGGRGGGIGYGGIDRSLGIEFDTWNNGQVDDHSGNHIGINLNGSMDSISLLPRDTRFNNARPWYAWVDYDGPGQRLEIRVSSEKDKPEAATLVEENIDLADILQYEKAFVGFTSGTGAAGGKHDVFEFEFSSSPPPGCELLLISSEPPAEILLGQQLNYPVEVSGADANAVLGYTLVTAPAGASIDGDGLLTWTASAIGDAAFEIRVDADNGQSASQSFTLNVLPPANQPPVASDVSVLANEDTAINFSLDAADADGDALSWQLVTQPANGAISGNAPNLVYSPNANFNGSDSLTYRANDGNADSNTATVSIVVSAVNDAPVVQNLTVEVDEDVSVGGQLGASDVEGDALSFSLSRAPALGTARIETDGQFSYTPNPNANGDDSFEVIANDGALDSAPATISVSIAAVNDVPVASARSIDTDEDVSVAIRLAGSDADGDALEYRITQAPANGVLQGPAPDLVYVPNTNYNGSDSLAFVVNDGQADSSPAVVSIQIAAVPDIPVASAQSVSVDEDSPVEILLGGSDDDDDELTYEITEDPANGSLSGAAPDLVYTPNADFNGSDQFSFVAKDALSQSPPAVVTIEVTSLNDLPTADAQAVGTDEDLPLAITLTGSDADGDDLTYTVTVDPANGSLSGTTPDLVYTPNPNFNGTDSFEFIVNDGTGDSAAAQISIDIAAINDLPSAVSQSLGTDEDTPLPILLSGADIDEDDLTFSVTTLPDNGTLSGTAPSLTYAPNPDFNGTDSFEFLANDGTGDSAAAQINIDIAAINDLPSADSQSLGTDEDTPLPILLNGADIENDDLTFSVTTLPDNGTLSGTAPNLTYTPNPDFSGTDGFDFVVNDGSVDSAAARINIGVNPINDAPRADALDLATDEDTSLPITLSGSDVEGDALTFGIASNPANGSLSGTAPDLVYTPNPNFNGSDQFTYLVNDGQTDSPSVAVSIRINPVNDLPIADSQAFTIDEDTALPILLTGSDVDNDDLTFTVTSGPANGSLSGTAPNLTYTPEPDFSGTDGFDFVVNDGNADSASARISIEVNAVNDTPVIGSTPVPTGAEGEEYRYQVEATDPDDTQFTYSLLTAPDGMSVDDDGLVTWIPGLDSAGDYPVEIEVSDAQGARITQSFTLTIADSNSAPQFTSSPAAFVVEGDDWVYTLEASDADGDNFSFSMDQSPPGAVFDPDTDTAAWSSTGIAPGTYQFEFSVIDTAAGSTIQAFEVEVLTAERAVSHEGREFWIPISINATPPVGYPPEGSFDINLVSTDRDTQAAIEVPALGIYQTMQLTANQLASFSIDPVEVAEMGGYEVNTVLRDFAIHITAQTPIAAYFMNQERATTDGYIGMPVQSLGTEYISATYSMLNRLGMLGSVDAGQLGSMTTIVATENDTRVTIDAIMDVFPGGQEQIEVGTPIELILNRGDVYHLESKGSFRADLTGSMIRSDKPIGVFGHVECVHVPRDLAACDHLIEQLPPIESLSTDYLTVPFWGRPASFGSKEYGDTLRVVAPHDGTEVYLNDVLRAVLDQGEYYEFLADGPRRIHTTHPTLVMQYANGSVFDQAVNDILDFEFTDPFMVLVPPAEQFLKRYTVNTPARDMAHNRANLIVPTTAITTVTVNGEPLDENEFNEIPNSDFSYAQIPVAQGANSFESEEPFGLYLYGYDYFESYGYLGGMAFSPSRNVASLSLSADVTQSTDFEWCAEATATDSFGRPVNGVQIRFNVDGVNSQDAYRLTDARGVTQFCYRGIAAGFDTVGARVNQITEFVDVLWNAGTENQAPVIRSLPALAAVNGDPYSYQVVAEDPEGETLTYTLLEAPNSMTIDSTGLLNLPKVDYRFGKFRRLKVVISVADPLGAKTQQAFEISEFEAFNTPPEFLPATVGTTAIVGVPYVYNTDLLQSHVANLKFRVEVEDADLDAVFVDMLAGPPGGYIQRVRTGAVPDGRPNEPRHCRACTHYLRWVPDATGSYPFELGLRDARGGVNQSQTFNVVVGPNQPPEVVNFNPPRVAAPREEYSYTLELVNDVPLNAFENLDDLKIVFESAPYGMWSELVQANDTQKLRIYYEPHPSQVGVYTVSFRVEDRLNSTPTITFELTVVDDNLPPEISLQGWPRGEVSIPYEYQIQASDPEGEALTYSLVIAPDGMTIDENTGVVSWVPTAGNEDESVWVRFAVADARGLVTERSVSLYIQRFINRAPTFIPAYRPTSAKVGVPFVHQMQAVDREGDYPLSYRISSQTREAVIDEQTGLITWTPANEGRFWLRASVMDSLGKLASSNNEFWYVDVLPADTPLDATLTLAPDNVVDPGESATLQVTPLNAAGEVQVSLTVDGESADVDSLLQVSITPESVGRIPIVAEITDGVETVTRGIDLFVRDPADNTPPVVQFHAPINVSTISSPTDIVATVTDDNLVDVLLAYRPADEPIGSVLDLEDFTVLYQGPDSFVNEAIVRFDTSLLLNGTYHIFLQATDSNDNSIGRLIAVNVDGDLKVGNFSITLEDLNIPLAGIPISVSRTYDSRRRHEALDFGYGWSIDYQNTRLQESDEPSKGWTQSLSDNETFLINGSFFQSNAICIDPSYDKSVTITLPDGEVEKFLVTARPSNGLEPAISNPNCYLSTDRTYDLHYLPVEGTQSTLEADSDNSLYLAELSNGNLAPIGDFDPQPITRYRMTTRAGFVYHFDEDFGVEQIVDPNGHSVSFSDSGIVHSSGKAISFVRDAGGRITRVVDPTGNEIVYAYDANGDLTSVTDRSLASSTHTYDSDHGLVDLFDALGSRLVRNIYDDDGRLIAQEDADGNRTDFNHDLEGRVSVVMNRRGFATQYQYDDRGNVLTQIDALGNTTSYAFDDDDNQLSMTDALGNTSLATYNDRDDQLTQTDELGNTVTFTYNELGQRLTVTDARGNAFENTYDAVGNQLSITDPDGNTASNTYLGNTGLPLTVTDALGHTTSFTYDDEGNKLTETDALGNVTTFTYDDNNNVASESRTRSDNGSVVTETTRFEYDAENRLVRTTDALGHVIETEYDGVGNEIASIDALGRRTEMDYDAYNRLIETRYPDGTRQTMAYDAGGNLETETDRLGRVTSYAYDALDRLVETTHADGSITRTEYDEIGRVSAEIDANGNRTQFKYDAAGRRIARIDALGNRHSFEYDADGNLVREIDANGHSTEYVYDSLDRRVETRFHDGTAMQEGIDALGRRVSMTDQAGIVTEYGYDALGRLTEVTDALGGVTSYTFDEVGNKLTQTDAEGRTTTWTYDALGRVLTRTLPFGQTESMSYDENGNLTALVDFNGDITTYIYDVNDRVTMINYSQDGSIETFDYDAKGNRTRATNAQGDWVYTYDSMNRLESETQPNGDRLEYAYDNQGNKTELTVTYANGSTRTDTFTYDVLNRMETVMDASGGINTYRYDAVGNRSSTVHANGSRQTYSYDSLNRLTQLNHYDGTDSLINQFDYTLHPTGRRIQIDELNGRKSAYTYDDLYRLTNETINDPANSNHTAEYEYDKVGNRIYSTIDGVSTAYSYDDNDRLTQQGGETYTYDAQGNTLTRMLDGFTSTYAYDAKQKLVQADINNTGAIDTSYYQYNPDGIRTASTVDGATTQFIVDSNQQYAQVIAESDGGNIVNVEYTHGDDLLSQNRGSQSHFYMYDGLGSTRDLTDSAGNASDAYYYDAFGNLLANSGSTDNKYRFTGEQYDAGLDHYYLRARYYGQSVGRFTQMDSWTGTTTDPITLHKYLYANANPVNMIDPSGKFSLSGLSSSINIAGILARTSSQLLKKGSTGRAGTGVFGVSTLLSVYAMKPGFRWREIAVNLLTIADNQGQWRYATDLYNAAGRYLSAMGGVPIRSREAINKAQSIFSDISKISSSIEGFMKLSNLSRQGTAKFSDVIGLSIKLEKSAVKIVESVLTSGPIGIVKVEVTGFIRHADDLYDVLNQINE